MTLNRCLSQDWSVSMYDLLVEVAKIYFCLGLATFIHFMWVYRKELGPLHVEHPVASLFADAAALVKCIVYWPKIQYLNVFGKDKE